MRSLVPCRSITHEMARVAADVLQCVVVRCRGVSRLYRNTSTQSEMCDVMQCVAVRLRRVRVNLQNFQKEKIAA